jgi:hypothetical protein
MNDDLHAAQAKVVEARTLVRILSDRIYHMNQIVRSRRLEHDELIQLAHCLRSTEVARDRAMDDARGWRRIVDRLEGHPGHKGSISLSRGSVSLGRGSVSLGRGSVCLGRSSGSVSLGRSSGSVSLGRKRTVVGPGYLTRMMGPS